MGGLDPVSEMGLSLYMFEGDVPTPPYPFASSASELLDDGCNVIYVGVLEDIVR